MRRNGKLDGRCAWSIQIVLSATSNQTSNSRSAGKRTALRLGLVTLGVLLPAVADGAELPREFRVFSAGVNATSKGEFVFDEDAAADVMAAYATHGADVMLDLEHLSLESPQESRSFDPDARAWCRLELRNGELWAVDVRWTPDGERRLRDRTQRYISPAFQVDPKTRRITELVNIAITAMPATHGLTPLVAANAALSGEENTMTGEQLLAVAEALGLGGDANIEDVLAAIGAMMTKIKGGMEGEASEPEASEAMAGEPEKEDIAEAKALRGALLRETNAPSSVQALSQVAAWKASHLSLEADRQKLARERAAMELSERKELVAELVKIGAETPATCGLAAGKICKRLTDEPIGELRDRVTALSKMPRNGAPKPPTAADSNVQLSERELAMCAEKKIDPAAYAARKAAMTAKKAG